LGSKSSVFKILLTNKILLHILPPFHCEKAMPYQLDRKIRKREEV